MSEEAAVRNTVRQDSNAGKSPVPEHKMDDWTRRIANNELDRIKQEQDKKTSW
jgi:hypothetical protein